MKMPMLKSNPLFAKTVESCKYDRRDLEVCLASEEYQEIMSKPTMSVDARALIVED